MKNDFFICIILLTLITSNAWSWGKPVYDSGANKKEYAILLKDMAMLKQLKIESGSLSDLKNNLSGVGSYGSELNDNSHLNNRLLSDKWSDSLKGISGGNTARYSQLKSEYEKNHNIMSTSDYKKGMNDAQSESYSNRKQTAQAASLNSSYEYNNVNKELKTIHNLSGEIDKAKTEKQATDVNSRLIAELLYLQAEQLRMQAVINKQLASQSESVLADESAEAKFTEVK